MKRLFLTDLDNTALGGDFAVYNRFPDAFSEFLDDLAQNGWAWGINTSWDPAGQMALVQRSSVRSAPAFLIGEFGRRVALPEGNEFRYMEPYTSGNNQKVKAVCRDMILPMFSAFFECFQPDRVMYYEHLTTVFLPETTDMEAVAEWFALHATPELIVCISNHTVEVRPAFLSKGLPLDVLVERYGFEQIVCAGDSEPDLKMMESSYAKFPLAPANAEECVKNYVLLHGGAVGRECYGAGIIDAFRQLKL